MKNYGSGIKLKVRNVGRITRLTEMSTFQDKTKRAMNHNVLFSKLEQNSVFFVCAEINSTSHDIY